MKQLLVFALVLVPIVPAAADEPTYLRVGSTGIYCVMAPCPSWGLTPADSKGEVIGEYVWAGDDLPPVVGSEADKAAINAAWADKRCLLVQGAYIDETISVDAVVGDCN